ncbi:L,D-transpeptidase family protein [Candidatus Calescamantes bacterium]|nr:L,D-transpeptidase family protein [Candidatus Calescamantes bacterium]
MKKKKFLIIFLVIIGVVSLWGWKKGATQRKIFRLKEILEEANNLFEKNQWEESLRLFEEFLNNYDVQNPPFPADLYRIYYRIGYCYEEKGDREKADKYWDKTSDEYKPIVEFYQGLRLWKDEDYLKCREKFLALLDKYPKHPMKEKVEDTLMQIHDMMLYGDLPFPGSIEYEVKPGDSLYRIAKKFSTTIDLLMRKNHLSTAFLKPGMKLTVIPLKDFSLLVDLDHNLLYLQFKGKFFKKYPIASGKDNLTPTGNFSVVSKLKNPVWYVKGRKPIPPGSPENILGSRWIGIDEKRGIGIHEAVNPQDIGKYVSNGCIRMLKRDVEELYDLVIKGTPVEIVREGSQI